jgi:3-methyl-2-oxobutanoate hydroxymethyltransferase
MDNIEVLMKAGANAVKIEAVAGNEKLIRHLTESGIPVVGHIGLTPSHHHMVGGFKVQGKTLEEELQIVENGKIMQDLGCFCVVVEAVPPRVGHALSKALEVPVIGVGAGVEVDGQAMVLHDMLGMITDFKPKFVRQYLNGAELIRNAVNAFVADVHELKYPNEQEVYAAAKDSRLLKKAA